MSIAMRCLPRLRMMRFWVAPLPADRLYGFGLRILPPRPFPGADASTTVAGTGFSTVAWQEMSMAMRCLPRLRMMRLWGPATDAGTVGAASGKGITLFVMSGDCTSQPPSQVQSLAARDVANRAVRSRAIRGSGQPLSPWGPLSIQ
jgi:hypothetical protein